MEKNQQNSALVWIILVILLVLRIISPILFAIIISGDRQPRVANIIQVGTYFLILLLIIIEREKLDLYHIDKGSVILIILFAPFARGIKFYSSINKIFEILFWVVNILFFVFLIWKKVSLKNINPKWLIISSLLSILIAVPLAKIVSFQPSLGLDNNSSFPPLSLVYLVRVVVYHISQYAIFEEPVFRGVLWGKLRAKNVDERKILIIQAGLFWVAHIDRTFRPMTLLITIPIASIYLGIIAWKSRSLAPPIISHGLLNAIGSILQYRFFN